jgi:UDP-2,3-diacylglucosamine pyrophosphatase LpxH
MKLLWLTDIHFDFLSSQQRAAFLTRLANQAPQAVLLGGDISTAPRLTEDLESIGTALQVPIYFVLGNHDFYYGSIVKIRRQVRRLSQKRKKLFWLEDAGCIHLTDEVALVGHGCWGDGRAGDYWRSSLELTDFFVIDDFKGLDKGERLQLMRCLGEESADHLGRFCREAARRFRRVIVLTHVTPFFETCLHEGRSDPGGLPFFCCQSAGEVLAEVAMDFLDVQFTVLSGHTHSQAHHQILPNLKSRVSGAHYYDPGFELLEY